VAGDLSDQKADLIIHFQLEGESAPVSLVDAPLRSALSEVMKLDGFEGKADTSLLWHSGASPLSTRSLTLGLGKREALSGDALRRASAAAGSRATTLRARRAGVALAPKAWGMTLEEAARIVSAGVRRGALRAP